MLVLLVVTVLGLDGVRGKQDGGLGRAVDAHVEDGLLHLEEEQVLRHLLHQLLAHVFGVELGEEEEDGSLAAIHVLPLRKEGKLLQLTSVNIHTDLDTEFGSMLQTRYLNTITQVLP